MVVLNSGRKQKRLMIAEEGGSWREAEVNMEEMEYWEIEGGTRSKVRRASRMEGPKENGVKVNLIMR